MVNHPVITFLFIFCNELCLGKVKTINEPKCFSMILKLNCCTHVSILAGLCKIKAFDSAEQILNITLNIVKLK